MRRGKRRVHIVDADGKAQGEISSAESSSQSTTNPAPNYRPSQSAAGGRPAAPRSSSHVRTSAGNMKGKAPSRYRTHRKPQRFGANRSDVSPDEGPSTRPYSTHSMPPQHTRSANPFMEGTRRSYDYEAPSKYSLQTRPQSMYSAVPELVPYVGYSSPYGPGSYTMPQHMAQYLYSQPPPPAPPPEEVAPPKTPAPPLERSPPPPPSQKRAEEGVEITNLRKQLELFKQEQKKREDLEKQKELEDKIRKDAEEKMAKIMEEMRLAQEQTKMEIEKARIEATMAARQAVEAERKAEEDRRRLEEEEAERCRRIAEEKIAAEVRAEAERVRLEKEEADRLSREMQAKVEQQQEERRRLQQQEKEDLERLRQEIIEQVRAEILERERRYLSSSSGSRSFSSRSSRSSNSYMSLSSTSEGGSNDSNSPKRRSRKSSLGRAAKVPSVKASSLKVAEAKTPASVLKEDASTSPPDPFVYLVGTSPPPPETEEDTQTQPYSSWEQTPYTMGWHYQPYATRSENQDSVYQNNSNINQGGVPGEQELDTLRNVEQLTVEQVRDWDREVEGREQKIRQFLVYLENNKAIISPEEKAKMESQADQLLKPMVKMRSGFKETIKSLEMIMSNSHDQEGKE
ncbi:hypothetical protein CkaCkLH20_05104 [Colletotrichum karsti]|uniref:Reticulocyte-binding protein 2-like protein a n=1 Tax=Colletotrichum karsti TaxID=1095194 RepID=A0A9P6I7I0_9PEZI|nr:uncharacterized protein CkaCkLH20_05104 [Colletotrichum karsti]KAF9877404.1 hypothetical protein CkaCkLH20_05104 [Colletotrichum karsti]